ncbi:MAG: hypothetical protein D3910_00025 [Candidatus Electrothrix sp. ATG2]|nr:hypothetical protein [Candidatus Electrothrix sp. ATG2]
MLYAYRSLCRELFVKKNSVELYLQKSKSKEMSSSVKNVFRDMFEGSVCGLRNLEIQKKWYDQSLKNKKYDDMRYVIFNFNQEPDVAFSCVLFPDFDFLGNQIQILDDHNRELELITFCSAPTPQGWAYVFAWHKNNATICEHYIRSLVTLVHEGQKLEDILFRLIICCENIAISTRWWETLPKNVVNEISAFITDYINPFSTIDPNYLSIGISDSCKWKIDTVQSYMN